MNSFSFIHASDIHLDSPFSNISSSLSKEYAEILRKAPFTALEKLIGIAIEKNVDFVLLVGDIYNGEDKSIRGRLALIDCAKTLQKYAIQLFIVAGNHDPLLPTDTTEYPSNTVFFPTEYTTVPFIKNGKTLADIHGISHNSLHDERTLQKYFQKPKSSTTFQIGMLHCTVGGAISEHNTRYTPCTLEELKSCYIQYWALGHIHKRAVLSEYPHVVYPGNTQGLKSGEEGLRGVYHVTVEDAKTITMDFIPTAPVIFETLSIELEEEDTIEILREKTIEKLIQYTKSIEQKSIQFALITIQFVGITELDKELREHSTEWIELLQDAIHSYTKRIVIQNICIDTCNSIPLDELLLRKDLLGEAFRVLEKWKEDPEQQEILLDSIKTQVGTSTKFSRLKQTPSGKTLLENIQKTSLYLFEEGK